MIYSNILLICFLAAIILFVCSIGFSHAANIKVLPSASRVTPGENFYIDISVENIPSTGIDTVQFKLNVNAPGSVVAGVSDVTKSGARDVAVSTPLTIGLPALNRSGIGDFFWNASGHYGILVMDNEELKDGKGLYSFAHTNSAVLPSGNGSVARFYFAVGKDVVAENIEISLTDVALVNAGDLYQLDANTGAVIELRCMTKTPDLLGLSLPEVQSALQQANLTIGNVYEIDNQNGTYALNKVLAQSSAAGTSVLCGTAVDLAINTPPSEVGNASATDKAGDESGTVTLSWIPSNSADTTGYRIYLVSGSQNLLTEIKNPVAAGTEISGLSNGQTSQLKITAFDNFGNESSGVIISAVPVDDIAPRITVSGVTEGAFYSSAVLPIIDVMDANLSAKEILLNGIAYAMAAIGIEGNYTLKITATDSSGNATVKEIHFVIDKTPPAISVSGIEKGKYYSSDVTPVISVSDTNLQSTESLLNGSAYASGSVITAEGTYELKINTVDKAGNQSSDTYVFYIDKTKPTSSITIGDPKFINSTDVFVKNSTPFTLTGKDEGTVNSGLGKLEYRLNNSEWNVYSALFALTGLSDGIVVINYRAIDSAGNAEEFQTVTVKTDNTPPVTTANVGSPKYVGANGVVSISPLTEITLTAEDALSGVSKTEYMIGNGQWTIYAPFKLNTEGMHTIKYRSSDNLGNVEAEKILEVVVDTTAPVSTINIGDPQYKKDEKLYISASTEISISAVDTGSASVKTEYKIDNSVFMTYTTPITLASYAEGQHTITYRSTDNIGNVETEQTITVTLDNASPQTTISASDPLIDGVTNIGSPKTMFALASTDNLSGVKEMKYKIDSGAWKTYMADFGLSSLSVGTHTISYKSVDNVLNEETEKTITLKLINIDVTKEIYSKPVVLAGAWHVVDGDDDDHHHKDKMKDTENAINNLATILASSGIAYYIPQNDREFKETFRSGRYNTYILVNFQDELLDRELTEAVNYGDGLIFIKTTPYEDTNLDVFGVNFNGKTRHRELTVNLQESPISSAGTLQMDKKTKAVRTEIISTTAQSFGTFTDGHKSYPAIISNQYGRGKVILFTFDLLNCPDQTKVASLLINSINYVKPAEHSAIAFKSIPVNIKLNNSSEPVDIRLTETLPANASADSIYPQGDLTGDIITWQKTLNANEKATFSYYLNLPDIQGSYTLDTELKYNNNGSYRIYGNYSLTVNVQNSSSELLQTIIADLKAVAATANHRDQKRIRKAIEKLSHINTDASTKWQIENNIWRIILAINDLQKLSFDSSDIRWKLDELLKIWEAKWYQADYKLKGKDKKDKEEEWDEHEEYKKCKKDYDAGDDD